jgi:epoxyqueuosine reductase
MDIIRPEPGMFLNGSELAGFLVDTIGQLAAQANTVTEYRDPLVGFAAADDPRFVKLQQVVHPTHMLPRDMLPGARSVVSFFLPFAPWVVEANSQHREQVAREWATAYVETNSLIGTITAHLAETLSRWGIRAAAAPATHNFDPVTLVSRWSHKSVAIVAGLGSFGVHQMVITDAGCAGRFGSLVLDAELPVDPVKPRERCSYFYDGTCLECVARCPANALDGRKALDKHGCHQHLHSVVRQYQDLGLVDVCGKCAIGPCAFGSAVH